MRKWGIKVDRADARRTFDDGRVVEILGFQRIGEVEYERFGFDESVGSG